MGFTPVNTKSIILFDKLGDRRANGIQVYVQFARYISTHRVAKSD